LEVKHDASEDDAEIDALQASMDAIEVKLQALDEQLVDSSPRDKDLMGVVLTIAGGKIKQITGLARVSERKQVLAEVTAREKRETSIAGAAQGEDAGTEGAANGAESPEQESNESIPERLMLNLSAHRTAALQACMVANQKVTLAALAQRMASSVFHDHRCFEEPIKISRTSAWHVLEKSSPTVGTSRAAQVMGNERSRWEALLPQDKATWLQWFIDQPLEVSLSMIVFGTAETANALQGRIESKDTVAELAKTLGLDMRAWWEPTPENFLDLVPKAKLIGAVTEAKGAEWAKDMIKLKKAEAIAFTAEALAGTGWVPMPLR
jgi:ParB family chromosome partitioning protein